jgi:uncharacterized protein YbjT (DUF2867 family)
MKIFITGGTGFIGQRVVRKLIERGHQVQALVRTQYGAEVMAALGAQTVWGDITASESMRDAMCSTWRRGISLGPKTHTKPSGSM